MDGVVVVLDVVMVNPYQEDRIELMSNVHNMAMRITFTIVAPIGVWFVAVVVLVVVFMVLVPPK